MHLLDRRLIALTLLVLAVPLTGDRSARAQEVDGEVCVNVCEVTDHFTPFDPFGRSPLPANPNGSCEGSETCSTHPNECGGCSTGNPNANPNTVNPVIELPRYQTLIPGIAAGKLADHTIQFPVTLPVDRPGATRADGEEIGGEIASDYYRTIFQARLAAVVQEAIDEGRARGGSEPRGRVPPGTIPEAQGDMTELGPEAIDYDDASADNEDHENNDPVHASTGEFRYEKIDLELPGIGVDFVLKRVYRSRWSYPGFLGAGWTYSYDQRLVPDLSPCGGGTITWLAGDGGLVRFTSTDGRLWEPKDGSPYRLFGAGQPGWRRVVHPDGMESVFDGDGMLKAIRDLNGNAITFVWDTVENVGEDTISLHLESATDTMGRFIDFIYADGMLSEVSIPSLSASVRYTYDPVTRDLHDVTDLDGFTETYGYLSGFADVVENRVATVEEDEFCGGLCGAPDEIHCTGRSICGGIALDVEQSCIQGCIDTAGCTSECGDCSALCASTPDSQACLGGPLPCTNACSALCQVSGSLRCAERRDADFLDGCRETCTDIAQDLCSANFRCQAFHGYASASYSQATDEFSVVAASAGSDGWCVTQGDCTARGFANVVTPERYAACLQVMSPVFCDHPGAVIGNGWPVYDCDDDCYQCLIDGTGCPFNLAASGHVCEDDCTDYLVDECLGEVSASCGSVCAGECGEVCSGQCTDACRQQCDGECASGADCRGWCRAESAHLQDVCESGCMNQCLATFSWPPGFVTYGRGSEVNHNLTTISNATGVWLVNQYGTSIASASFDRVISQSFGGDQTTYRTYRLGVSPVAPEDQPYVDSNASSREVCPTECTSAGDLQGEELWVEADAGDYILFRDPNDIIGSISAPPELDVYGWYELEGQDANGTISPRVSLPPEGLALATPEGLVLLRTAANGNVTWAHVGDRPLSNAITELSGNWHFSLVRTTHGWIASREKPSALVRLSNPETCIGDFSLTALDDNAFEVSPAGACRGETDARELGTFESSSSHLVTHHAQQTRLIFDGDSALIAGLAEQASVPNCEWLPLETPDPLCLRGIGADVFPGEPGDICSTHWAARGTPYGISMGCRPEELPPNLPEQSCEAIGAARNLVGITPIQSLTYATVVRSGALIWTFYADDQGRTVRIVNGQNNAREDRNFDSFGRLTGVENAIKSRSCSSYDDSWNLIRHISLPAPNKWAAQTRIEQTFLYGPNARLWSTSDPNSPSDALVDMTWDDQGNLRTVEYAGTNHRTELVPDDFGRISTITAPDGTVTRFVYEPDEPRPTQVVFDDGGQHEVAQGIAYDDFERIEEVSQLGKSTRRSTWSQGGFLELEEVELIPGVSAPLETIYHRDSAGLLSSIEGPLTTRVLTRSPRGSISAVVEHPNAEPTILRAQCFDYDARGRLLEAVDGEGRRTRFTYDNHGEVFQVTRGLWAVSSEAWDDPCGTWTDGAVAGSELFQTIARNSAGQVTRVTTGAASDPDAWTIDFGYDGFGRTVESKFGTGELTRIGYDARSLATWTAVYKSGIAALPAGLTNGEPSTTETRLRALQRFDYDSLGRKTEAQSFWFVDDASGNRALLGPAAAAGWLTAAIEYLDDQGAIRTQDALGNATTVTHDGLGRVESATHPGGVTLSNVYTDFGRVIVQTIQPAPTPSGLSRRRYELTDFGAVARVFEAEDWSKPAEETTFDLFGRPETVASRGQSERIAYDPFGEVGEVGRLDANGVPVSFYSYQRNRRGEPKKVFDGNRTTSWTRTFDFANRLATETDPVGGVTTQTYRSGTKAPAFVLTEAGDTRTILYDKLGGIRQVAGNRPSADPLFRDATIQFTRNLLGVTAASSFNRAAIATDDVVLSYRLDSLGFINRSDSNKFSGATVQFTRDPMGRATSTIVSGKTIGRGYDGLGRVAGITLNGTSVATPTYTGWGGPSRVDYGNGIQEAWSYDDELRVRRQDARRNATSIYVASYIWGADGTLVRTDRSTGGPTQSDLFLSDVFGRVSAGAYAQTGVPAFTAASGSVPNSEVQQRILAVPAAGREAFLFNVADAFTRKESFGTLIGPTVGADQRYLDFGGQVTSDAAGNLLSDAASGTTFGYDGLGRTVTIARTGQGSTELRHDAFGRLTEWTSGAGIDGGAIHYGDEIPLRERTATGERIYLPGLGLSPIAISTPSATLYNHHLFGDRVGWTTSPAGAVVERVDYTAHGRPTIRNAAGTPLAPRDPRILLTGQLYFNPLGLHRMQQRWYRPDWSAFTSRDPLRLVDGPNAYLYAMASPIMNVDPSGLDGLDVGNAFEKAVVNGIPLALLDGLTLVSGVTFLTLAGPPDENPAVANLHEKLDEVRESIRIFDYDPNEQAFAPGLELMSTSLWGFLLGEGVSAGVKAVQGARLGAALGNSEKGALSLLDDLASSEEGALSLLDDAGGAARRNPNLIVEATQASDRELEIAAQLSREGRGTVIIRDPTNVNKTSDLLIDGVEYDIYSPISRNPDNIIAGMAKKNRQCTGVVLDLSRSPVRAADLRNVLARVRGAVKNTRITDIIIIE